MQLSFNGLSNSATRRIVQIAKRLREYRLLGYAVCLLTVGAATAIQWMARDAYGGTMFLTIYPAAIVTTLIGGLGPGFLSTVLGGISQWGLFIPAFHWLAAGSYAFDATLCVTLVALVNRALDGLLADIEQEKQTSQTQDLLARELNHRIQNLFAVVQAIVEFSLRGQGLIEQSIIKQRLTDRIHSMSVANRAITESMGAGVRLIDLINREICGLDSKFDISGGAGVILGPQMTQNLALILHELITNALKYGALSVPDGKVTLRLDWRSTMLTLDWQEHQGRPALPPSASGFGSYILERFARTLCQDVDASYTSDGFSYRIRLRSDQVRCEDGGAAEEMVPHAALQTA